MWLTGRNLLIKGLAKTHYLVVNAVAPASLPKFSPTEGMGYTSLKMLSFSGFKSTQILTSPDFFGTSAPGSGWSTLEITPMDSIHSSSCDTLSRSGRGTFRGVDNKYGTVSSLSWILYSSPNVPSPSNTVRNPLK